MFSGLITEAARADSVATRIANLKEKQRGEGLSEKERLELSAKEAEYAASTSMVQAGIAFLVIMIITIVLATQFGNLVTTLFLVACFSFLVIGIGVCLLKLHIRRRRRRKGA